MYWSMSMFGFVSSLYPGRIYTQKCTLFYGQTPLTFRKRSLYPFIFSLTCYPGVGTGARETRGERTRDVIFHKNKQIENEINICCKSSLARIDSDYRLYTVIIGRR